MAGSYNGVAVPSDGKKIGYAKGKYEVPDRPVDSVYRRRWNWARHLEGVAARVRRGGGEGIQGQASGRVV